MRKGLLFFVCGLSLLLSGCGIWYRAPTTGKTADITFNAPLNLVALTDPYKCSNQLAFYINAFTEKINTKIPASKLFTFRDIYYVGKKNNNDHVCSVTASFYPLVNRHYTVYPRAYELSDNYQCALEIYQDRAVYSNGDIDDTVYPVDVTFRNYIVTNSFWGKGYCDDALAYQSSLGQK
jgi:hypothetical protein